jgi:hypothetical protein
MTIFDMRTETSVLVLLRSHDQIFPLLPIRPLNSIPYTGMLLGDIHKTKVYELIKLELLDARKLGLLTRITGESIKALIDSLPKGVGKSPQSEDCRDGAASRRLPKAAVKRQPNPGPEGETKPPSEEDSPGAV